MKRAIIGVRFGAIIAGLIVIAAFGLADTAQAQGSSDARAVTLELSGAGPGGCTITVYPDPAEISRGPHKKIKKVEWVADQNPKYGQLYWELRYKASDAVATGNYFGDVDLPCGLTRTKEQPKNTPKKAQASWPYSVTVYRCENGVKATVLCSTDPRIRWDD